MTMRKPAPGVSSGPSPVLALENVVVSAPGEPGVHAPGSRRLILDGVSLSVNPGEAVGLVGPSGVGKTLLTRAALGLLRPGLRVEPPTSIRIEGVEMMGAPEARWREVRGRRVGAVFQSPGAALTPVRTVGAQLREVLRCHGMDEGRADSLLDEVGLDVQAVADRAPHELSGGMRQRALLALALAPEPELLIADEPTAALDVTTEARIVELLGALQRRRRLALLVVSHDPLVVQRLCTRRVHLRPRSGKGTTVPSYPSPGSAEPDAAGSPRPRARAPRVAEPRPRRRSGEGALLQVEGLKAGYDDGEWVVKGVDLHLRAGELLGLVGPSGCGKTTLLRGILGLAPARRGRILLDGREMGSDRAARLAFRSRVQGVWQDALGALDPRLSVARALEEALRVHDPGAAREDRLSRAKELLTRVGLQGDVLPRRPGELSGGQRQRVGLARALALEPEVLLLDEPVSALDAPARAGVMELISGLLREEGAAGILCAHDLGVVARRCDRVVVMADGRIVEEGDVAELVARPRHPLTVALAALAGER